LHNLRLRMRAPYSSKESQRGHVTFDDVTSGEKAPLGRILRNFRLRMCAPHPSKGTPKGSRDVLWRHFRWKGPTTADIAPLPVAHAHSLLPVPATWLTSLPLTGLPVAPPRSTSNNNWAVPIYYLRVRVLFKMLTPLSTMQEITEMHYFIYCVGIKQVYKYSLITWQVPSASTETIPSASNQKPCFIAIKKSYACMHARLLSSIFSDKRFFQYEF